VGVGDLMDVLTGVTKQIDRAYVDGGSKMKFPLIKRENRHFARFSR
jgi:hypothetical protein